MELIRTCLRSFFLIAFLLSPSACVVKEDLVWAPMVIDGYTIPPHDETLVDRSGLVAGDEVELWFICTTAESVILSAKAYMDSMEAGNQVAEIFLAGGICTILPGKSTFTLTRRFYIYVDAMDDLIAAWEIKSGDGRLFYALLVIESFKKPVGQEI